MACLSNFLVENRIEFLKQQNAKGIDTSHDQYAIHKKPSDIIDHFAQHADPSSNKQYTQWLVGQYKAKNIRQEDAPGLKDALELFHNHKHKLAQKDINKYQTPSDLRAAVAPYANAPVTRKEGEEKIKNEGLETIYDDGKVSVHHLKTEEASRLIYGGGARSGKKYGTDWCTAADSNGNMFKYYTRNGGKLHTVHVEGDPNSPYQFDDGEQFMDRHDMSVDPYTFFNQHPHLKPLLTSRSLRFAQTPDDLTKYIDANSESIKNSDSRARRVIEHSEFDGEIHGSQMLPLVHPHKRLYNDGHPHYEWEGVTSLSRSLHSLTPKERSELVDKMHNEHDFAPTLNNVLYTHYDDPSVITPKLLQTPHVAHLGIAIASHRHTPKEWVGKHVDDFARMLKSGDSIKDELYGLKFYHNLLGAASPKHLEDHIDNMVNSIIGAHKRYQNKLVPMEAARRLAKRNNSPVLKSHHIDKLVDYANTREGHHSLAHELANSKHIDSKNLDKLYNHWVQQPGYSIAYSAVRNPRATPEQLSKWYHDHTNRDSKVYHDRLSQSIVRGIMGNPNVPSKVVYDALSRHIAHLGTSRESAGIKPEHIDYAIDLVKERSDKYQQHVLNPTVPSDEAEQEHYKLLTDKEDALTQASKILNDSPHTNATHIDRFLSIFSPEDLRKTSISKTVTDALFNPVHNLHPKEIVHLIEKHGHKDSELLSKLGAQHRRDPELLTGISNDDILQLHKAYLKAIGNYKGYTGHRLLDDYSIANISKDHDTLMPYLNALHHHYTKNYDYRDDEEKNATQHVVKYRVRPTSYTYPYKKPEHLQKLKQMADGGWIDKNAVRDFASSLGVKSPYED